MSFVALVFKNLFRQRVRSGLAVLGIALGITTVVALGVVTGGLKSSMGELLRAGGADFVVAQEGASDLSFSTIRDADLASLAARPDVARVTGALLEVTKVESRPYFFLFGLERQALPQLGFSIVAGRGLGTGADDLVLGEAAADELGAAPGDTVVLANHRYRVVGIFRTGEKLRDEGGVGQLETVRTAARKPGLVTIAYVTVAPGRDSDAVAAAVERELPQLTTISSIGDVSKVDQGIEVMDAANLAISLLAVGIGAIGVMNTMVMSVYERTREIGILRAVGWRSSRILRMVVLESLLLCVLAAAVGIVAGVLASRALLLVPTISAFLTPVYSVNVFVRALGIGVLVALAGAAYPAIRAVRLSPMEALRYE
ncbi:MAG TPA: ABC transporter permease [Gaiellaceae bacterium]|nr:ABC transporter permease [Gaiellaceae bacterium]